MELITIFLQWLGPLCFIGLQASSFHTAINILKMRSVGQLSAIPFLSLLVNCVVWSLYGYLRSDNSVLLPNASGTLVSLFCIFAYSKHSITSNHQLNIVTIAVILFVFFLAYGNDYDSIGKVGCILSVVVSGAPLAVIRTVIRDKSTASIPFSSSAFMWVNNIGWTAYGYCIAHDVMIYGPMC